MNKTLKFLLQTMFWLVLYVVILNVILSCNQELLRWKVHTYDLDNDGIFVSPEHTIEQEFWFDWMINDTHVLFSTCFFNPIISVLLTIITHLLHILVQRNGNKKRIIRNFFICYFTIALLMLIPSIITPSNSAVIAGATKDWEYWTYLFFSGTPITLFRTVLFLLVIESIIFYKNK